MNIIRISSIVAVIALVVTITGSCLYANTIIVDPNGLGDFTSIQAAIDSSRNFDTVIVYPGIYFENIDFRGRAITVRSIDPNDSNVVTSTIIDGKNTNNVVMFSNSETRYSVLLGVSLTNGKHYGVYCKDTSCHPKIWKCSIYSNSSSGIYGSGTILECFVSHNNYSGIVCTDGAIVSDTIVSGNRYSGIYAVGSSVTITNTSVSGNNDMGIVCGPQSGVRDQSSVTVSNCVVQNNSNDGIFCRTTAHTKISNCIIAWNLRYGIGANSSATLESKYNNFYANGIGDYNPDITPILDEGNMHEYPWFVLNGYMDEDGVWHEGDYHLLSTNGRWDPIAKLWVNDPIDSPCLDKGDPNTPLGKEPMPNGSRINIGAYGGTLEASMSAGPGCIEYPIMDFNKDCIVDQADLDIFMEHWLECNLDDPNACPSE